MKKFCALFFLAAMIFAGCGEKDDAIVENPNPPGETPGQPSETPDEKPDETPALTIGTTKYTFPAEGGSVRIQFYVNVDWKISIEYAAGDSGWLTSTLESGEAGDIVLPLTAESNPAVEQRSATVHILYGGKLCEVFVIQSAGTSGPVLTPVLIIENTAYAIADEAGSVEVPFEVNVDWETSIDYAAGDSGWLTLTPESGEAGNAILTITAEANLTAEQRKAFVRILYGGQSCELLVIQLEMNENMNITEAFDPLFAQVLQQRGYIPNASYILYGDVRNITQVYVFDEGLTSLQGIEYFSALTSLDCCGNSLTSLDVSGCTALTGLGCTENQLTSLDISKNTSLTSLGCSYNPGNGSVFYVMAWFDNNSIPSSIGRSLFWRWTYINGNTVYLQFLKIR